MSDDTTPVGLMTLKDHGKTPLEIAKAGFHVVIPGTVFHTVTELLERLKAQSQDNQSMAFIVDLLMALEQHGVPVKPKVVDDGEAPT